MIIYIANLKSFLNEHTDYSLILGSSKFSLPVLSFFICIKHHFILKVLFQSGSKAHSKTLSRHSNIQGTRTVLRHLGTQKALGYSGTWGGQALRALRHLGPRTIRTIRLLSILFSRRKIVLSVNMDLHWSQYNKGIRENRWRAIVKATDSMIHSWFAWRQTICAQKFLKSWNSVRIKRKKIRPPSRTYLRDL